MGYPMIARFQIQDIADRADVGRTTFYLHYRSKDDLFMGCHEAIVSEFQSGPFHYHPLGREELLSPTAPAEMTLLYRHLEEAWPLLYPVFQGKDGPLILQRIRDEGAREIKANLQAIFAETDSIIPLDILVKLSGGGANRAGAMVAGEATAVHPQKTWPSHSTTYSEQLFVKRLI